MRSSLRPPDDARRTPVKRILTTIRHSRRAAGPVQPGADGGPGGQILLVLALAPMNAAFVGEMALGRCSALPAGLEAPSAGPRVSEPFGTPRCKLRDRLGEIVRTLGVSHVA